MSRFEVSSLDSPRLEALEDVEEAIGLLLDHARISGDRASGFPFTTVVEI